FGFSRPDWLDGFRHQRNVNRLHRQTAEYRVDIGFERRSPLSHVSGVPPARLVRGDIFVCAAPERHSRCSGDFGLRVSSTPRLYWIDPFKAQLAAFLRHLASVGEGDRMQRAEAHVVQSPISAIPENPAFRSRRADTQIKATAIGQHSWPLGPHHRDGLQPTDFPRHASSLPVRHIMSHTLSAISGERNRMMMKTGAAY